MCDFAHRVSLCSLARAPLLIATAMPPMPCAECSLGSTSVCRVNSANDVAGLAAAWNRQSSLPAKRMLMREGDTPSEVYRVQAGWGLRFKVMADGSRQILSFVLPGDFLTLELLHEAPIRFSMMTLTRMTLCAFSREKIARDLFADPVKAAMIGQRWANRVSDTERRLVMLGRMPAEGRIAELVLDVYRRLDRRGMVAGNEFAFPLRHEDLADAAGLTPAHVSRTLTALRRDRLLEIHAARAIILDCDGLQTLAP